MSTDYPDVPMTTGVPPVRRDASNTSFDTEPLLTKDSEDVSRTAVDEWGIYTQDGALALEPDSITAVEYMAEHRIAAFPLEAGDLETYDKVRLPFETRVVMTKGGTLSDRRAFLAVLETMRADLNVYDIVTPEAAYSNVNIQRVSLGRTAQVGASLLTVEIGFVEIRQTVNVTTSTFRSPASAPPVNNGSVQTAAPSNIVKSSAIR